MVKKFTIPFASQGDANDIPDALQVDGKVSFTQGFGYDYERPYDDPQAKDIAREDMNGLFKAITSAVGELQTLGASEWSSAISYPKGAIVYHEKDLYISQVDDNQNTPPQNWVSITSIASDSLKKAANLSDLTNKATARNNLGLGSSATLNKTDVIGTSTNLVATQKLVNDTKINLESSKQDKLIFVGDGPEVMKTGAYGLGGILTNENNGDINIIEGSTKSGFYNVNAIEKYHYSMGVKIQQVVGWSCFFYASPQSKKAGVAVTSRGVTTDIQFITNINTTTDKSGFLRAEGSADALTTSDVTQSLGASTTSVMSQKAVTDRLNSIESSHGLGYGQSWVDVTSQRVSGTTYTNNTGKPISVFVTADTGGYSNMFYVDDVSFIVDVPNEDREFYSIIIPAGSTYKVVAKGIIKFLELR